MEFIARMENDWQERHSPNGSFVDLVLTSNSYNPRQKSWNTCVRFPFPKVDLGISGLSASKYTWLNIGEGEGTLQWEQKCEE